MTLGQSARGIAGFGDLGLSTMKYRDTANMPEVTFATEMAGASLAFVVERQVAIERKLDVLINLLADRRPAKEWYTPVEVAEMLGKRPYTVREWCRLIVAVRSPRTTGAARRSSPVLPAACTYQTQPPTAIAATSTTAMSIFMKRFQTLPDSH